MTAAPVGGMSHLICSAPVKEAAQDIQFLFKWGTPAKVPLLYRVA